MKICPNGHLTGTKDCGTRGAKSIRKFSGDGRVLVSKYDRPRDENGRNSLDELRRSTRGNPRVGAGTGPGNAAPALTCA